jgi:hypothetical protein
MLAEFVAVLGPKILAAAGGAIALLVTIAGVYFKGRSAGKADARAKQAEATLDIVADDKEARDTVESLSVTEAKRKLGEWSRS